MQNRYIITGGTVKSKALQRFDFATALTPLFEEREAVVRCSIHTILLKNAQSFCPISLQFGTYDCLLSFKRLPAEGKLRSFRVVVEDDEE